MSIEVRNVSKRFGDFVALDDVSLDVEGGSLTALLGPSGSGKSTLLRIIAGLEQPDTGVIGLAGEDATALTPQKRGVGFVFQHYAAFKHMTVRDNIAFGLKIRKRPKPRSATRVDELLELVQLARASATAIRPSSPAASGSAWRSPARSPSSRRCCCSTSRSAPSTRASAPSCASGCGRLHEETHTTTVFVTHDQEEAMEVADRIVVMNQGASSRSARRASSTTGRPTSS